MNLNFCLPLCINKVFKVRIKRLKYLKKKKKKMLN